MWWQQCPDSARENGMNCPFLQCAVLLWSCSCPNDRVTITQDSCFHWRIFGYQPACSSLSLHQFIDLCHVGLISGFLSYCTPHTRSLFTDSPLHSMTYSELSSALQVETTYSLGSGTQLFERLKSPAAPGERRWAGVVLITQPPRAHPQSPCVGVLPSELEGHLCEPLGRGLVFHSEYLAFLDGDSIVILGDFNAHVGTGSVTWRCRIWRNSILDLAKGWHVAAMSHDRWGQWFWTGRLGWWSL